MYAGIKLSRDVAELYYLVTRYRAAVSRSSRSVSRRGWSSARPPPPRSLHVGSGRNETAHHTTTPVVLQVPATDSVMRWIVSGIPFLLFVIIEANVEDVGGGEEVRVTAALPGDGRVAAALAELAVLELQAAGTRATYAAPPPQCLDGRADGRECRRAVEAALARGRVQVALLAAAAGAVAAAARLRDAGLDELSDLAPPRRRACLAPPPARSLLDLADAARASHYYMPLDNVTALFMEYNKTAHIRQSDALSRFEPEWCSGQGAECATVVTGDPAEEALLRALVRSFRLRARVLALGAALPSVAVTLAAAGPLVICAWDPAVLGLMPPGFASLGPPPCSNDVEEYDCAFESRRLVKLINAHVLARSPIALRALSRLRLNPVDEHELATYALAMDARTAAYAFARAHPRRLLARELRVAALLPNVTRREAYVGPTLAAAAALAEADLELGGSPLVKFKVETFDSRCSAARANQFVVDELGAGEFGALSAAAGPACGAAFADVARLAGTHSLPLLAYTAQSPPPAPALLAAGDARALAQALAALATQLGWRRLAVAADASARAPLRPLAAAADLPAVLDIPDSEDIDYSAFSTWAARAAAARVRVAVVVSEEARAVRAALCAGRGAGLTPARGAAWLLPATLPPAWLRPAPDDNCSAEQLREVAEGHLSAAFEWMLPWLHEDDIPENSTDSEILRGVSEQGDEQGGERGGEALAAWRRRVAARCAALGGARGACARPGAAAAALYDTLRLWAAALAAAPPASDLHDPAHARSLLKNATSLPFSGITGTFEWEIVGEEAETVFARAADVVVLQWRGGRRHEVGRWRRGRLALREAALRWPAGAPPADSEPCALPALADALGGRCTAAWALLAAALLAAAGAVAAAVALLCRRRAAASYRRRLETLGLHALVPKAVGLDRWELPRERIAINRKIGVGAFGTVYGGNARLGDGDDWTPVAVKTLKVGARTDEKLDFLSEAEAMKRFDHENVVRLIGVVTKSEPLYTVMELMLHGDLKSYLLARRHAAAGGEVLSARRLTAFALDVARALAYLAAQRYVHRDVAARNCLVSATRRVKLADFGMTRIVFENDYYRFSRKGMLPVRWMAPESLALGVFSTASDVWSFGVLLYEIITFGATPFQGLSNSEVLARVKGGKTLELPSGLKPQLENLIGSCWQREWRLRPAAAELAALLADEPALLTPCPHEAFDTLMLEDEPPWRAPRELAESRWQAWAPESGSTQTSYLSVDAAPRDRDPFLP